jgi:Ca2+-binding EF-hand superfamily protein
MHARLALTAIFGFLIASVALAQSNASQERLARMDRHFAYTDKDSDGYISRDEAAQYPALLKHFGTIDSDKDGRLSREEMQAYRLGTNKKSNNANLAGKKAPEAESASPLSKSAAEDNTTNRKNF